MSEKATFRLVNDLVRRRAMQACREVPNEWVVTFRPPTRTLEQNALLWVYLTALSEKKKWPVLINGQWKEEKMSPDDWKDLLSGSFMGDARRMAQGIDNTGLVVIGAKTSTFSKRQFSEFMEFVIGFCAIQNVRVDEANLIGV